MIFRSQFILLLTRPKSIIIKSFHGSCFPRCSFRFPILACRVHEIHLIEVVNESFFVLVAKETVWYTEPGLLDQAYFLFLVNISLVWCKKCLGWIYFSLPSKSNTCCTFKGLIFFFVYWKNEYRLDLF